MIDGKTIVDDIKRRLELKGLKSFKIFNYTNDFSLYYLDYYDERIEGGCTERSVGYYAVTYQAFYVYGNLKDPDVLSVSLNDPHFFEKCVDAIVDSVQPLD